MVHHVHCYKYPSEVFSRKFCIPSNASNSLQITNFTTTCIHAIVNCKTVLNRLTMVVNSKLRPNAYHDYIHLVYHVYSSMSNHVNVSCVWQCFLGLYLFSNAKCNRCGSTKHGQVRLLRKGVLLGDGARCPGGSFHSSSSPTPWQ